MYYNDELYHFGVKGMKWGVRKSIKSKINKAKSKHRLNKKIKKRVGSIESMQRKRYAETDISKLSDNDLRNLNNRIALENQYKANANTSRSNIYPMVKKGAAWAMDTLKGPAGKIIAGGVLTAASVYGAHKVEKIFSDPKNANWLNDPAELAALGKEAAGIWKGNLKPKK